MNRTARYKLQYVAALIVLGAAALYVLSLFHWSLPSVIVVLCLLLVPGRIQGYCFRDLFAARRLLEAGDVAGAIGHTEQFLSTIRERPHLKRLSWLGGVIYTADPEAMALNNLGSAHMQAGDFEEAKSAFNAALRLDPQYPLPFDNLAVLSEAGGDRVEAEQYLRKAEERGHKRTQLDRVIHQGQALLAQVEGRPITDGSK